MSGRIWVDLLVDYFHSKDISQRRGARMALYDASLEQAELDELIECYTAAWEAFPYNSDEARIRLAIDAVRFSAEPRGLSHQSQLFFMLACAVNEIMMDEPAFLELDLPDNTSLSVFEVDSLKKRLRAHIRFLTDHEVFTAARNALCNLVEGILDALPDSTKTNIASDQAVATVPLLALLRDPLMLQTQLIAHFTTSDELQSYGLYSRLTRQLYMNTLEASGVIINPDVPLLEHDTDRPVFPKDCARDNPLIVAERYFAKTPLLKLLQADVPFVIPQTARFEHMHIVAGTGHGKTQTLQHLIVSDLQQPPEDVPSMVILDSQGDMINTLKRMSLFDPSREGSLARRLLLVDPSDVAFAPALNLFDVQSERLKKYDQRDREQVLAGIIEIYDYIFGGLLGAELTQKQAMVFRFLAQLMLSIPGATIHTLRDLLIDASPYMDYVAKLPDTARGFFETQFFGRGYNQTREQILRRLYGVLQNPSFERMFASPQNRLDLFETLNAGGIVLVNTAKDFLKSEASSIFGRYIIALTLKAAFERAALPSHQRRPTFLWIDEASEYFDDNIDNLLIQSRKFNLGICTAHQYMGQLTRNLPASLMTNTSIKLVGGTSDRDAKLLAPEMRANPDFLNSMVKERDKTNFATYVRNHTPHAIPLSIPFGTAEKLERMSEEQFQTLLEVSRKRLSVSHENRAGTENESDTRSSSATIPQPDSDEFWEEY